LENMTALDLAYKYHRNDILEILVLKGASTADTSNMKKLLFHGIKFDLVNLVKILVLRRGLSFSEVDLDVRFLFEGE